MARQAPLSLDKEHTNHAAEVRIHPRNGVAGHLPFSDVVAAQPGTLDEVLARPTSIMDHNVAGSFTARISGVRTSMAAENIAAGTKTWAETFRMWQTSPGHNANLLQSKADIVGVAVARNEQTRYKTYWAMVIAEKPSKKERAQAGGRTENR
jgi:hypothetical protein